jgi:hypothetical protein
MTEEQLRDEKLDRCARFPVLTMRSWMAAFDQGDCYLAEKTWPTAETWMSGKTVCDRETELPLLAAYALYDYHKYMEKGGSSNRLMAVLRMSAEHDLAKLESAMQHLIDSQ